MARSYPGQLSLFDNHMPVMPPPPPLAPDIRIVPPPLHEPDENPVFFAILAAGKAVGEIVAAGTAMRAEHGIDAPLRPSATLHVSVLGVAKSGDIDAAGLARVIEAGNAVALPPFELGFDAAVGWGKGDGPKPVVLPCEEGSAELELLADLLRSGLRERGLTLRARRTAYHLTLTYDRAFVPKMTLARPIRMPVREFTLVRSMRGEGRYETIRKWGLAG